MSPSAAKDVTLARHGPRYGRPSHLFGPPTALFSQPLALLRYNLGHLENLHRTTERWTVLSTLLPGLPISSPMKKTGKIP